MQAVEVCTIMDSIRMVGPQGSAKTRLHQEGPSYIMQVVINACNQEEPPVRFQAPQLWLVAVMSVPHKCQQVSSHPMVDGRLTRAMLVQVMQQTQAAVEAAMQSMLPLLQLETWMCKCAARCQAATIRLVPQRRVPYPSDQRPCPSQATSILKLINSASTNK